MNTIRPLTRASKLQPWTCSRCISRQQPLLRSGYSTRSHDGPRRRSGRGLATFAAIAVATGGYLTFTDSGRYIRGAADRTGRVAWTLLLCVNDYRKTLKQWDDMPLDQAKANLKECHQRCADRTFAAMETNGSVFIKLGQHLSSLNYLLPTEWCDTFIPLQDKCPVSSFESIKEMVEKETGEKLDDIFEDFSTQPLGSASLAQVHLAIDKRTGQRVAVKVQHPVLDLWAPLDLWLTKLTFQTLKTAFPDYDLTWLSDEMEVSLPKELDFVEEGQNAIRAKEYFSQIPDTPLVIPGVLWARRRVLVMEYITGHRLDDLEFLDSHGISRDEVSASLARIFNTMIFSRDAPLHCDPHGGNLAIRRNEGKKHSRNFEIILYDHGLYRMIPLEIQRNYAKLWLAVLEKDETNMRRYAKATAGITDEQFPLFASAITGRDYRVITKSLSTPRSSEEKRAMSDALGEGLLQQLVQLLGQVPRVILLVLKTNDLTRSLDTNLQTRQGPVRSFLILARYAAQTVYDEQVEQLRAIGSTIWPPGNVARLFSAWISYTRVRLTLVLYESLLYARSVVGLSNALPAPAVGK